MSLVTKIAARFVFDKSDSPSVGGGFVTLISGISVTGLTLGVTALLVVTSVMNGFDRELKGALTAFHGHILLFSKADPVSNPTGFIQTIKSNYPEVTEVSPYFFLEAMLSSKNGVSGTIVEGIDLNTIDSVSSVRKKLVAGELSDDSEEITLGVEVAKKLKVSVGDPVVLTIPFANQSDPLAKKLKVSGIVKLGMYDYDNKYSIVLMDSVQKLLGIGNKANAFKIVTKDLLTSLDTTNLMNEKFSYPLRARDWSTLNRNLFYAIKLEKIVIAIILLGIVLVASFNVISTIMMLVHDKKKQISMLKALGLEPKRTLHIFLLLGFGMALSGVVLGVGFGRFLCQVLVWKPIVDIPADIYGLARLPIEIRPLEWLLICVFVVILALIASYFPSRRMSRESPVEGIRYE